MSPYYYTLNHSQPFTIMQCVIAINTIPALFRLQPKTSAYYSRTGKVTNVGEQELTHFSTSHGTVIQMCLNYMQFYLSPMTGIGSFVYMCAAMFLFCRPPILLKHKNHLFCHPYLIKIPGVYDAPLGRKTSFNTRRKSNISL